MRLTFDLRTRFSKTLIPSESSPESKTDPLRSPAGTRLGRRTWIYRGERRRTGGQEESDGGETNEFDNEHHAFFGFFFYLISGSLYFLRHQFFKQGPHTLRLAPIAMLHQVPDWLGHRLKYRVQRASGNQYFPSSSLPYRPRMIGSSQVDLLARSTYVRSVL